MFKRTPIWKISATSGGCALTSTAVWLNAEHVASAEGWLSPLVTAGVVVTLCAAVAPPFAERAAKSGQWLKSALLWLFFGLAVCFSLSASISRSSGYASGKIAMAQQSNAKARLTQQAFEQASQALLAECATGRGPKCRALEQRVDGLRAELANAPPVQSTDPGAARLASVLKVDQSAVALYVPLFLPLGLELGGFIFLAVGLAPATRRRTAEAVEALKQQAQLAKPKRGTKAYFLARLESERPDLARRVHSGHMSVYKASVEAGIRKISPRRSKWTQIEAYRVKPEMVSI